LPNVRTQQILSSMAGIMATVVLLQPAGERCARSQVELQLLHAVYRAGVILKYHCRKTF
jgi:hypothetical protein